MNNKLSKIEKYLLEKDTILRADNECISDGEVLVNKFFIQNKVLKDYKNCDFNIMEQLKIPYEKGIEWEIPDCVNLLPCGDFEFVYDDKYSFSYELISLFTSLPVDFNGSYIVFRGEEKYPVLQIFDDVLFVGLIMPMARRINKPIEFVKE